MQKILYLNILLTILICAILAKTASEVISYRLSHTFPATEKQAAPVRVSSATEELGSFSPILEKGLFGKATQGKLTAIAVNAPRQGAPANPGDLVLLGTATGSFRESFALIRKTSTREEMVFRLGEKVFDLGELVAVRKETAEILAGGSRIKIQTPVAAMEESSSDEAPAPAAAGRFSTQITAPGSYVIEQRTLNAALDNIGQVMTDARLLPSVNDGKVEGFKVSEVRPSGLFAMVGIKNGDVLKSINDFNIDSPEKAIQTLASLKGQTSIKLDLIRDGQPATFTYEIR